MLTGYRGQDELEQLMGYVPQCLFVLRARKFSTATTIPQHFARRFCPTVVVPHTVLMVPRHFGMNACHSKAFMGAQAVRVLLQTPTAEKLSEKSYFLNS